MYPKAVDKTIRDRLPFYTIACLAHRLGYITLAAQTLDPANPDAYRFRPLVHSYASRL